MRRIKDILLSLKIEWFTPMSIYIFLKANTLNLVFSHQLKRSFRSVLLNVFN